MTKATDFYVSPRCSQEVYVCVCVGGCVRGCVCVDVCDHRSAIGLPF